MTDVLLTTAYSKAQLRLLVHRRLWIHPHLHLGAHPGVGYPRTILQCTLRPSEKTDADVYSGAVTTSLIDGGAAGLFWGYVLVSIAFLFIYASLAEMAAM